MSTDQTLAKRARYALGQFLVIALGVLGALWVDAWWEGVQEVRTEQEMLMALVQELDSAEVTLREYLELDSRIQTQADVLLEVSGLGADSVASLMDDLFHTIPREAALPTIEEATSTGRLRLFRNADLRVRITDFVGRLRSLNSYVVQAETQWNEVAKPTLYQLIDFDDFAATGINRHWGSAGVDGGPSAAGHPDTSLVLRNIIRDRRAFSSVRTMLVRRRLSELTSIRGMAGLELNKP